MSTVIHNTNILAVDTAPAMLEALRYFADRNGYGFHGCADPADAVARIEGGGEQVDQNIRCVLLGWPVGDTAIIADLLNLLSSPDYRDLPLVIVCQEEGPEIAELTQHRPGTSAVLWKEYQQLSDLIDHLPVAPALRQNESPDSQDVHVRTPTETTALPRSVNQSEHFTRALLVDRTPRICQTLKDLMVNNGYKVTVTDSVQAARELVFEHQYDLIVTDYHLHDVSGHDTLEAFLKTVAHQSPHAVTAVNSAKYTNQVIENSRAAGGAVCLFKNDPIEKLFASIHALTTSLSHGTFMLNNEKLEVEQTAVAADSQPAGTPVVAQGNESGQISGQPGGRELTGNEYENESAMPDNPAVVSRSVQPIGAVSREKFHLELGSVLERVADSQHSGVRYNVLLLDVQMEASTGDRLSLGDSGPMCRIVEDALARLYKRPLSLTYLGNGQFALLLANRRLQDALTLTRKILQVVPKMVRYLNDLTLVSHSAVVQVDGNTRKVDDFLEQSRAAAARTRSDRRDNCALVLPLKKYLTAHEVADSSESSMAS